MANKVNAYWKNVLTIVPIIGAAVATIIYLLRLYCRRMKALGLLLEDYLMGAGLIISYCATAFVIDTAFNGVGLPVASLPKHERLRIQFGSWMIQKFWAPSMAFVKISIVVFIKRLFGSIRAYTIISYCLIAFIALWAVTALLVNTFQCIPVQYYYDKDLDGHCMKGQVQFFQTMGSIALIEDIIILCLPLPVFWNLKINIRQKIALMIVFSLGGLVCIFSLMRLIEFRNFQVTDLASSSAKESIWTCLELDVAIICGSLPLLNPLVQGLRSTARSGASKYNSQPYAGSSHHLQSMRGKKTGFRELDSDHAASTISKGANAMASTSRVSTDMESNRQDVDGTSDMGSIDPVIHRKDPI
ncbi:hypothetical protein N7499_007578 [Penicillium canescens]|uniref:Rhodopsin domain-containing protein n=1 Tax=Penicillium canescens TaxID=5083 RepID=A0AAD6NA75_PENCN|nr:uncharacterized protein N7446_003275 [Penicillium canescens]KAJ5996107.1 hypothetical protein N7522_007767 [Penicillium canescens]KAJ6045073.1 hypothetical protein N7460_006428 [Penicillium canescens]KAJ6056543.1 hypothetical protein N7444_005641 [Penicillium canescens]KAJ6075498.1 hypothetical protein N7446_003275 [Penicillium canescens]KAJ6082704.1 hypothetical protein N7499_007578 [Penicillium canescens]